MNHIPDQQLVELAQAGDRKALGDLLQRYRSKVFSMTMRILGNRDNALDAAQEAFLRACKHLHKFEPQRAFGPWIRTIAVRTALDQVKQSKAHRSEGDRTEGPDGLIDRLPSPSPSPMAQASAKQLAREVEAAIQDLSPAQRAAFTCKHLEGLDTAQTAKAMGCRKATVRWHLFEARKKLASNLQPRTENHSAGESQ